MKEVEKGLQEISIQMKEQIDIQFKELREEIGKIFEKQKKEINKEFEEQNKSIEKKFEEQDKRIDKKFEEQDKRIDKKFEEQDKKIEKKFEERFEKQNKELAIELRNIVEYICNRNDKKINNVEQKVDKEIKNNKVAHDGYNAKMYKIELSQSNLESKVYDLESSKKITSNV